MQYGFIAANSARFAVDEMCECFGLSRSGYYDWSGRDTVLEQARKYLESQLR